MERILVSMDARRGSWEAWSRAISLAKRIEAHVYALLVLPAGAGNGGEPPGENVKHRLELLIELAKAEGITVDYFISEGSYEEEVIRFAAHNKISLMVAEPPDGGGRHLEREFVSFQKIRHRIRCRMELVSPRKLQQIQPN